MQKGYASNMGAGMEQQGTPNHNKSRKAITQQQVKSTRLQQMGHCCDFDKTRELIVAVGPPPPPSAIIKIQTNPMES